MKIKNNFLIKYGSKIKYFFLKSYKLVSLTIVESNIFLYITFFYVNIYIYNE